MIPPFDVSNAVVVDVPFTNKFVPMVALEDDTIAPFKNTPPEPVLKVPIPVWLNEPETV